MEDIIRDREDLRELEVSEEKESRLQDAYEKFSNGEVEMTLSGEKMGRKVGCGFDLDDPVEGDGVVVTSKLSREGVFPYVSEFSANGKGERVGNCSVEDPLNNSRIEARIPSPTKIFFTADEKVPYETFRDYVLFVEKKLRIDIV